VLWDLAANQIHADFLVSASRTNPEILRWGHQGSSSHFPIEWRLYAAWFVATEFMIAEIL
jgi:hypothetical protein